MGAPALLLSGRRAPSRWQPSPEPLDDTTLVAKVRALGGTARDRLDDPDMLELVLPGLRSDHRALAGYRDTPGVAVSCPIVALAGDADGEMSVPDVAAWRHHTTGEFELQVFPGGHFFIADRLPAKATLIAGLQRHFSAAIPSPAVSGNRHQGVSGVPCRCWVAPAQALGSFPGQARYPLEFVLTPTQRFFALTA